MALVHQLEMIATGKDVLYGDNCTIEAAFAKYTGLSVGDPALDNYLSIIEQVAAVSRTDLISTIV